MANGLKGHWDVSLSSVPSEAMNSAVAAWAGRCDEHIRGKIGFTRGAFLHRWHGHSEERGYEKRWAILSYHQFDPAVDLTADSQGLYSWTGNKPRFEDGIRLSLGSRNEDAI